jgi:hypothetical protein
MQMMGEQDRTVIAEQMRSWDLTLPLANPPNVTRILSKLVHMRQYVMDMAYVHPYTATDTRKAFKQRIYDALKCMDEAKIGILELRIVKKYPATPWRRIWTNLHVAPVTEMVKLAWFAAIHDIVPTNDMLAAIRLTNTNFCAKCGKTGSIQHTITECMEGRLIWTWTQKKTSDDTSYGSQTYTTRVANTTRLPVLAPATAGGALMDHCPSGILQITIQ